jgi:hypothetical protein
VCPGQTLHTPSLNNPVNATASATVPIGHIDSLILFALLPDHFFQLFGYFLGSIVKVRIETLDV